MQHLLIKNSNRLLVLILIISQICACSTHSLYRWSAKSYQPSDYDQIKANTKDHFLKLHYPDGSVIVYQTWEVIEKSAIKGLASKYDIDRKLIFEHKETTSLLSEIDFIETNQAMSVKDIRVPIIVTTAVVTIALGGLCLAGLAFAGGKPCFGSCPTIYGNPEASGDILAESFSDAISKSLENQDIDPLTGVRAQNQKIELAITNEAYESHLIKKMDLLAFDPKIGNQIFHQANRFFEVSSLGVLSKKCTHIEDQSDCTEALSKNDQIEALSKANPKDLGLTERYLLEFDLQSILATSNQRYGLTLTIRNSLLNTFLFYQAWAWLGAKAGDWLVKLDQSKNPKEMFNKIANLFGDLQVNARLNQGEEKGQWVNIGMYDEIGPIAQEKVIFEMPNEWSLAISKQPKSHWQIEIELLASRSNYRIDFAQIVQIEKEHTPRLIPLHALKTQDGKIHEQGTMQLLKANQHFLIQPAEHFILSYQDHLAQINSEYFLAATGYYLEWMHKGWQGEPNEEKFIELIANPTQKLKELAPIFKQIEPFIDQAFWNSRVKTQKK